MAILLDPVLPTPVKLQKLILCSEAITDLKIFCVHSALKECSKMLVGLAYLNMDYIESYRKPKLKMSKNCQNFGAEIWVLQFKAELGGLNNPSRARSMAQKLGLESIFTLPKRFLNYDNEEHSYEWKCDLSIYEAFMK